MPTPSGGTNEKQVSILITAKDLTAQAFKSFETKAGTSLKAIKQGVVALEASILAMSAALNAVGVTALKKMVDATKQFAVNAVDTASTFEQLRIQFGFLFGDVEVGKKKMEELWEVAKELPFTIKEMARSAKLLKVWSAMGEDIKGTMTALSDITSLSGEKMELVARVIGRAWQQGRFLQRGPGLMIAGLMKTKMGFDATQASVHEFRKALARLLIDPQFGIAGMANTMATTFMGIQSMIGDAVTNLELALADAGLFKEVKAFAEEIRQWLKSEPVIEHVKKLGRIITTVVEEARQKFDELIKSGDMSEMMDKWIDVIRQASIFLSNVIKSAPELAVIVMNIAESIARAMATGAKMFSEVLQGSKALIGQIGILGGKVGELERASGKVFEKWVESNNALTWMKKYMVDLKNESKEIGDSGILFQMVWNDVTRSIKGNTILSKQYGKELKEINDELLLTGKMHHGIGRNEAIEDVTERMIGFYQNLIDQQKGVVDGYDKQYQSLQSQLGLWQENSKGVVDFNALIDQVALDMAKLKKETQDLFKGDEGGDKKIKDDLDKKFKPVEEKAEEIEKKMNAAFDIGAEEIKIDFVSIEEQWSIFHENLLEKWRTSSEEMVFIMKNVANATAETFENVLFDMIWGEMKTWQDYLEGFLRDVSRAIAQMAAQQAVASMFMGGGGSKTGYYVGDSPVGDETDLHKGGFAGYTDGGIVNGNVGFDKVPINATKGELILNRRQQSNLFNMINNGSGGMKNAPVINITNQISSMDGTDTFRVLERNSSQLMAVLNKVGVNGSRGFGV